MPKQRHAQTTKCEITHIVTLHHATRGLRSHLVHGRTPTSTTRFDHVPPTLEGPVRPIPQRARLRLQLAVLILNALPIMLAGLVCAGHRIQSHFGPSFNQENIFHLRVVARALLLPFPLNGLEYALLDLRRPFPDP